MQNQVQFIATQNIGSSLSSPVKDGGEVFVRVLKDNGGGSFTVSFAGNRVNVTSERSLSVGDSFKALLKVSSDGKVLLSPSPETPAMERNGPVDGKTSYGILNSLMAQGFTADGISERMIAFFQQTGLRVDRNIMSKARQIARNFPGKEEAASEAAALLLEKGIEADVASVRSMLIMAFGSDGDGDRERHDGQQENQEGEPLLETKKLPQEDRRVKELISLVNHTKEGPRHWVFLPYTWNMGEKEASGVIRMLLNLETNETEKIEINCKIGLKNYFFVLYYTLGKVKEVRFCSLPPLLTPDISKEEKRLGDLFSSGMSLGKSVPVTYSPSAFIGGICADNEDFPVYDSQA